MRFSKLTTMLAATVMAVTPVAATAQMPPPPPPQETAVRGPAITIIGVVLAVLIIALAIRAIGRPDRPISP